ncbi:MAG: TonB-dependent receptor [Bacteroidota bacterium]
MKYQNSPTSLKDLRKIVLLAVLFFGTISSIAQNTILDKQISINFQNDDIASALKKIEAIADCTFSYESIDAEKRTNSKNYSNATLQEILNDILVQYNLYYRTRGNTILIQNDAKKGQVTGTIISQNGAPVPYVSVRLKGTTFGASADTQGNFSFYAPEGDYILVASSIGFETAERPISILADETTTVNFTLSESTQGLDEVTVLGNREVGYVATEQSGATFGNRDLVDIPQSVSVITQEILIDQQVRSLADLVRNDPSVIASNPPGFNESISIRGYELDNSSSYRRENLIFQNQAQSPFENKAAVEIIKGPAAIRYGFAPPGGLVNYILKRPTKQSYAWVQTFGDTNGSIGVHGDFGGMVNQKFGYRINALVANEATFVDDVAGPRQMFSAFFEWQPMKKLRIDIEAEYQFRELEQQGTINLGSFDPSVTTDEIVQLIEEFDPTTFIGQSWGTYPTRNFVGSLGFEYEISDNWTAQLRLQQMNLVRDQRDGRIQGGTLQANGDLEVGTFFDPSQVRDPFSMEGFINGKINTFGLEHQITIGGAYSRNPLSISLSPNRRVTIGPSNIFNPVQYDFPGTGEVPSPEAGPTQDALIFTQQAFYVTDFIKISKSLEILAALRWTEQKNEDVFNEESTLQTSYKDDIFVPNFGIIYTPVEDFNLYGSYSLGITNGLQIPSEADNFGDDIFLDPVETEQYELGFKWELFKNATLTGAYFNIDQPLAFIDNNNVFRYGGGQIHQGVELTLAGRLNENTRVVFGGLFLDAEIDNPAEAALDGNRPFNAPEIQANFFVDYKLPINGLDVNGGLYYTGERFVDSSESLAVDGYFRLDLGTRYAFTIMNTKMTARLNVRNVTNNDFIESSAFGFLFGAPTTAVFSLAAEF